MAPNRTGLQQISLCCLLKTTFLAFPACPWGNSAQVRDHHAAGALRSQPKAVDGGHGWEGAGECSWSCSQLECAAQQCPLPAGAARDQSCTIAMGSMPFPPPTWGFWVSPLNLGMFPCCASPPEDRPFQGWLAPIPAPRYCLEMIFYLSLLLDTFSKVSLPILYLCSPTFLCLLVFLQSEQSSEPCGFPTEQRISLSIGAPLKCREAAETP